jgi:hypothetical protein
MPKTEVSDNQRPKSMATDICLSYFPVIGGQVTYYKRLVVGCIYASVH